MANILDYISWRGDITVEQSPFNSVDSLVLCRLSYIRFDDIVPGVGERNGMELGRAVDFLTRQDNGNPYYKRFEILSDDDKRLLEALRASERFRHMVLTGYVSDFDPAQEKQFSALTALPGDGTIYVAFRGTDNTIVGWKEDFNMSFTTPVPAQTEAVAHLARVAQTVDGSLRIGGHSKGGNLAVYAASFCDPQVQARISRVYNNDGPGLDRETIGKDGYQKIKHKIETFLPQTSIVGMMLEHEEDYTVVHSSQTGLLQHDPYSWEVLGTDFIKMDAVTDSSRIIDRTIKDWVAHTSAEKRKIFVDALYDVISATNARTVKDLTSDWRRNASVLLRALKNVDEETRQVIFDMLGALLSTAKDQLTSGRAKEALPDKQASAGV